MASNLEPNSRVKSVQAYRVPRALAPVDLKLDANEGVGLSPTLAMQALEASQDLNRYPSTAALEKVIAERIGISPSQIVVTAGADEAINRVCLAAIEPGQELLLPVPTFEMISHYAKLAGATVKEIEWPTGAFPTEKILSNLSPNTGLVSIVSPNNPTGLTIDESALITIAQASDSLVLLDEAYSEFAESDLLQTALQFENVVVTRTLSKAWGLAGLRIGYAVASETVANWLRAVGSPYPVSAFSISCALQTLTQNEGIASYTTNAKRERNELNELCSELNFPTENSQGNFCFATVPNSTWFRDAMAGLGIGIRAFPGKELLENKVRISLPGNAEDFKRLTQSINCIARPDAILFDLDGVIADVSASYREAIVQTAASFDVKVSREDIAALKAKGDANNDWIVSQRLLAAAGKNISLEEVTAKFEELYQGTDSNPGLRQTEKIIISKSFLERLRGKFPLAIVTGRPRKDAEVFLKQFDLMDLFSTLVCMEDSELKPNPAPVELAKRRLGVETAWMIGDTPDDMQAARGANTVLPIGVCAPGDKLENIESSLINRGAARVFNNAEEIEEFLK